MWQVLTLVCGIQQKPGWAWFVCDVCLVQGRRRVWGAHSHGECGEPYQNRQTKGKRGRFKGRFQFLSPPKNWFSACKYIFSMWSWTFPIEKQTHKGLVGVEIEWQREERCLSSYSMLKYGALVQQHVFFFPFTVRNQDFKYICVCGPVRRGWCSGQNPNKV